MNTCKLLCVMMACLLLTTVAAWGQADEQTDPAWTGQVTAGWTSSRGNSHTDSASASASTERKTDRDRISAGADYVVSRQTDLSTGQKSTTEDWWRLLGQYDYFFQPKWFAFAKGRYESDRIAELNSRIIAGAGVGYQVIKSDPTNFALEAGLAWKQEDFSNATPTTDDFTLQAGYRFDHQIIDTVQFLHDLTYYPNTDKFSDSYVTTSAEFRASFTKNMFSSAKVILSRDTTPAAGQRNSDIKYIVGLGINF